MISSSCHQSVGDRGGGDLDFCADGGGVGEDTGRSRGVSGISRGVTEGLSCNPDGVHVVKGALELGGGVIGALYVWFGRVIFGLKLPD